MSDSSRHRPSSTSPSTASVQHTASVRSTCARRPPPPVTTVVTTPRPLAWARDEPPSPKDCASVTDTTHGPDPRPSDAASYLTNPEDPPSRWWSFTLPRTARYQPQSNAPSPTTAKPERKSIKDISISWLPTPSPARETVPSTRKGKEKDAESGQPNDRGHDWALTLPPPLASDTLSHNMTPGWDDP
ncbi:hypothetical protein C0993_001533 [Termitomyces sp. T159_Od127]|nr:hypothetical protein C0993_001533 [Termitomyces sp. T159_Od127]